MRLMHSHHRTHRDSQNGDRLCSSLLLCQDHAFSWNVLPTLFIVVVKMCLLMAILSMIGRLYRVTMTTLTMGCTTRTGTTTGERPSLWMGASASGTAALSRTVPLSSSWQIHQANHQQHEEPFQGLVHPPTRPFRGWGDANTMFLRRRTLLQATDDEDTSGWTGIQSRRAPMETLAPSQDPTSGIPRSSLPSSSTGTKVSKNVDTILSLIMVAAASSILLCAIVMYLSDLRDQYLGPSTTTTTTNIITRRGRRSDEEEEDDRRYSSHGRSGSKSRQRHWRSTRSFNPNGDPTATLPHSATPEDYPEDDDDDDDNNLGRVSPVSTITVHTGDLGGGRLCPRSVILPIAGSRESGDSTGSRFDGTSDDNHVVDSTRTRRSRANHDTLQIMSMNDTHDGLDGSDYSSDVSMGTVLRTVHSSNSVSSSTLDQEEIYLTSPSGSEGGPVGGHRRQGSVPKEARDEEEGYLVQYPDSACEVRTGQNPSQLTAHLSHVELHRSGSMTDHAVRGPDPHSPTDLVGLLQDLLLKQQRCWSHDDDDEEDDPSDSSMAESTEIEDSVGDYADDYRYIRTPEEQPPVTHSMPSTQSNRRPFRWIGTRTNTHMEEDEALVHCHSRGPSKRSIPPLLSKEVWRREPSALGLHGVEAGSEISEDSLVSVESWMEGSVLVDA